MFRNRLALLMPSGQVQDRLLRGRVTRRTFLDREVCVRCSDFCIFDKGLSGLCGSPAVLNAIMWQSLVLGTRKHDTKCAQSATGLHQIRTSWNYRLDARVSKITNSTKCLVGLVKSIRSSCAITIIQFARMSVEFLR